MLSKLSAGQLAKVFNAVTDGKPVTKFESQSRALARTVAELERMGVSALVALARAGLPAGRSGRFPRLAVNGATGETVELRSLHGPVRTIAGDPEQAARKVASASVVQLRAVRQAKAAEQPVPAPVKPAERPVLRAGAKRTAASMGPVIAALRSADGATLAECTALAGWEAPFELRNLHIAARSLSAKLAGRASRHA